MLSMTGYGKGIAEKGDIKVTVELRAVNHRFLDLSFKLPKAYTSYQDIIRRQISSTIRRGHIDIYLDVKDNREATGKIELNKSLACSYIGVATELEKLGVANDLSASLLLRVPDMISIAQTDDKDDMLSACITLACNKAIAGLNKMRLLEGEKLKSNIFNMLELTKTQLDRIIAIAPTVPTLYAERLESTIKQYTENIQIDTARLMTEVALYADKVSIDEEIERLQSHFQQLDTILCDGKEAGRQLDFLVQECNREVNTIGSKSSNLEITKCVLLIKNEIEKIREQAQNVE